MQKFLVAAILALAFSGHADAESLFGGRNPYEFRIFGTQRGLNQALLIEQVRSGGPNTTVNSTTNLLNSQSTAADSISNITIQCENDAQCLVDALFNRDGGEGIVTTNTR